MTVHIIGAGMAGLSAAFALTKAKVPAVVYDAASHAGGRCYSFYDKKLNAVLDNGTHLMLGANTALLNMLDECPCETPLQSAGHDFLFFRKNRSSFTVDAARPLKALFRLPEIFPLLCESVMNTPAGRADKIMLMKTVGLCLGTQARQIYLACPSLRDSIVRPVEEYLKNKNVPFYFGRRLLRVREGKLMFRDLEIPLSSGDRVILALPPEILSRLVVGAPELPHNTILNIHYKTDAGLPENRNFIGLIGMTGHWAFTRNGILSVTISAADALAAKYSAAALADIVWQELAFLLRIGGQLPPFRVIAERRATLMQSRAVNKSRISSDIGSAAVFLAGDGTDTGLPCTIEGAVRSGQTAAAGVLRSFA